MGDVDTLRVFGSFWSLLPSSYGHCTKPGHHLLIHRIGLRPIDVPTSENILIQKKSFTNFLKSIKRCSVLLYVS